MSKNLVKNTFYIMIGNIGAKLLMLIMVPLYTNWLVPEEYGVFDLINSMACFFIPIVTLQLDQAVFRFIFEQEEKKENVFTVAFLFSFFVTFVLFCFTTPFFISNINFLWIVLLVVSQSVFNLIKEYVRGENKMITYSLFNMVNVVLILVINVITVCFMRLGLVGIYLSYIIAYSACSLVMMIFERPFCFNIKEVSPLIKKMLLFSIPLIPNTIAFWVVNLSDRFMIKTWLGEYYNGQYAIACKVPTLITTLYSAFVLAWQSEAIELIKKNDYKKITKILEIVVDILFSGMFVISAGMPLIYKYFINSRYASSLVLVPALLLGTVWLSISQFINGILIANYKTKDIGITTTIVAIINVMINLLFMKSYGVIIAVVSTAVAYFVLMALRLRLIKQCVNISLLVKIIIFSMLEFVFILYFMLDNIYLFWICLFITGIIFLFVNREIVLKFLKKLEIE